MSGFAEKNAPALHVAIVLTLGAVFLADFYTPLGVVVWVVYLVPMVLSYWSWCPALPLVVALTSTLMMVITFFTDQPGVDRGIAQVNRGFGIFTIWVMAVVGWLFRGDKPYEEGPGHPRVFHHR